MAAREFVLLLRTAEEGALEVAERIPPGRGRARFLDSPTPLRASVSIGLAVLPAGGTSDLASLINAADAALYEAKRQGPQLQRDGGGEVRAGCHQP